jgi:hypothetical protein
MGEAPGSEAIDAQITLLEKKIDDTKTELKGLIDN